MSNWKVWDTENGVGVHLNLEDGGVALEFSVEEARELAEALFQYAELPSK